MSKPVSGKHKSQKPSQKSQASGFGPNMQLVQSKATIEDRLPRTKSKPKR